jgi:hypothetical protein
MLIHVVAVLIVLVLVATMSRMCREEWDFDDFPEMCRRKLKKTEEDLAFANTPHFGGTPNNSQVWM